MPTLSELLDTPTVRMDALLALLREDYEKLNDYGNDSIPRNTAEYIELMFERIKKLDSFDRLPMDHL